MLELTWIEFFLRNIPEAFIMIWGINVISRRSICITKYIFSSLAISILTFFVRWLPIYFGVHIIINTILIISIMVIIGGPLIKSIYGTLLITFMLALSEFINMLILSLLNFNTNLEMLNPIIKSIYGMPSLIILSLFIIIINYLFKIKRNKIYL